jgi:uncharacterized protein YggE
MAKAEAIALSLNGKIARVVETVEGGAVVPEALSYANSLSNAASMAKSEYRTRIEAGSISLRGQITLVVEIEVKR